MMYRDLGFTALLTIASHFFFIATAFRMLRAVRFDQFLRPNHVNESRFLLLFIAIALGFGVSEFFLSLLEAARNLIYLVQ
ncbi:hypothetical protein IV56_GL000097 [Lacticaseibacillus saniviri JCM 17471 = DSM 24301]|uniref:DUF1146 domain-containing protein n=2 Tax=Lacticaseibacillus saniviri TaxID=931533 RepID=A0A0R2MVR4_9LACO|nr:hypothetical protein IV56_GL000097 [Lacticaseibacillus saniviri JCM 17471 = DSM 24301]